MYWNQKSQYINIFSILPLDGYLLHLGISIYIISVFNLNIKRVRLLVYALIPNETERTFSILFEILKEKLGFNPKIYTSDFQKSKAIKKIFPNIYFVNGQYKKLKIIPE